MVPLFLMEALLLGVAGSLLGLLGGIGLAAAVTALAVQLGAQVDFAIRPSPLLVGLALGIIATAVFGFLPVLRAGRTRPIGVLRDEDAPLPRIGWVVTSLVTLGLTGLMGLAAGVVLHNLRLGVGLAYGVVLLFLLFSLVFLPWSRWPAVAPASDLVACPGAAEPDPPEAAGGLHPGGAVHRDAGGGHRGGAGAECARRIASAVSAKLRLQRGRFRHPRGRGPDARPGRIACPDCSMWSGRCSSAGLHIISIDGRSRRSGGATQPETARRAAVRPATLDGATLRWRT